MSACIAAGLWTFALNKLTACAVAAQLRHTGFLRSFIRNFWGVWFGPPAAVFWQPGAVADTPSRVKPESDVFWV
jgi:hypothetical protein